MKILVTYSNTPNCIQFGNTMHPQFLKQPSKFIPILGGKAKYDGNNQFLKSMIGDDTLNNISYLNPYINEHSVIYWAGHNLDTIDSEYIGFCHYRRLFDIPDQQQIDENTIYVNELRIGMPNITQFIINHDPHTTSCFSQCIHKYIKTNDQMTGCQFIQFLNSDVLLSANMFIMHKSLFKQYMTLMTPIYNIIFNMIIPTHNVSDRSYGFILQRMNSFVILKMCMDNSNIKIKQGKYIKLQDTAIT